MSNINIIKSIRERTGLSLKEIKKVVDANPNISEDEVIDTLRKQGSLKQQARQGRDVSNGGIFTYVHEQRLGVMLEIKCETDFVARSNDFTSLGQDLCLHVAAYQPKFLSASEVDEAFVEKEISIAKEQLKQEGKPDNIVEKILEGKKSKLLNESSLLSQPFLKNPDITVEQRVAQVVQTTGENIVITRFQIFSLNN